MVGTDKSVAMDTVENVLKPESPNCCQLVAPFPSDFNTYPSGGVLCTIEDGV